MVRAKTHHLSSAFTIGIIAIFLTERAILPPSHPFTHTHTHTHMYIYICIYIHYTLFLPGVSFLSLIKVNLLAAMIRPRLWTRRASLSPCWACEFMMLSLVVAWAVARNFELEGLKWIEVTDDGAWDKYRNYLCPPLVEQHPLFYFWGAYLVLFAINKFPYCLSLGGILLALSLDVDWSIIY